MMCRTLKETLYKLDTDNSTRKQILKLLKIKTVKPIKNKNKNKTMKRKREKSKYTVKRKTRTALDQ